MASPAVPGLFLCFAAVVLLVLVSVSTPVWDKISFLDVLTPRGQSIRFGVWGYTGSQKSLGYTFDPALLGIPNTRIDNVVIHSLTFVLVLHPIAAGLAALAVLFGLCGAAYSRLGTVLMSLSAALATLVALVVWIIDMILWGIARNRIRAAGALANYGNANWLTLGAVVALFLGFCAGAMGTCGHYRRRDKY